MRYIYIIHQIKVIKKSQNSRNQDFLTIFAYDGRMRIRIRTNNDGSGSATLLISSTSYMGGDVQRGNDDGCD